MSRQRETAMWILAHGWESPVGNPPPAPATVIHDAAQLRSELQVRAAGPPCYFTLRQSAEDQFSFWLGGMWGGMSRLWRTAGGRSYRSARPGVVRAKSGVLFDDGREGILLPPEVLFPPDEVIETAVYFFDHRALPPRVHGTIKALE